MEEKRKPGRPKRNILEADPGEAIPTDILTNIPVLENIKIRMRDQREYIVLKQFSEGCLVAELDPDFGQMSNVHFWRSEFIAEMKKRNYMVPERNK